MKMECPKCTNEMVQGFVLDHMHHGQRVMQWAEGAPEKSFWSGGTKSPESKIPIGAFRCRRCGYLEFYARAEFESR